LHQIKQKNKSQVNKWAAMPPIVNRERRNRKMEKMDLARQRIEEAMIYLYEKLSKGQRANLKDSDFIFPDKRAWPIHDEEHGKIALVWATWPQHKSVRAKVVKAVLERYPQLKGYGASGEK
jgi:hypothetical protein